jgi:homoserine O-acetyltransferase
MTWDAQMRLLWIVLTIVLALVSFSAVAADYPAPRSRLDRARLQVSHWRSAVRAAFALHHDRPASDETRGHLTTGMTKFYSQQLQELLSTAPQRAM